MPCHIELYSAGGCLPHHYELEASCILNRQLRIVLFHFFLFKLTVNCCTVLFYVYVCVPFVFTVLLETRESDLLELKLYTGITWELNHWTISLQPPPPLPYWSHLVEIFFLWSMNSRVAPCHEFLSLLVNLTSGWTWAIRTTQYTLRISKLFVLACVSLAVEKLFSHRQSSWDTGKATMPSLPLGFLFSWEALLLLGILGDSQEGEAHGSMMAHIFVPHHSPRNDASMLPGIRERTLKASFWTVSSENLPKKSGLFSLILEARNPKRMKII